MRQKVYYSADELVTNLHTTGSQWMTENGVEYQGSYHEYITGEVYTQSTWKPTLSKKLVPILKPQDKKNSVYRNLNKIKTKYKSIQSYSPTITSEIIKQGFVNRYFIKKINEQLIVEIDKTQYKAWQTKKIDPILYTAVQLAWIITGNLENTNNGSVFIPSVATKNKKQINIAERQLKGLSSYLTNLTEFFVDTDLIVPTDINTPIDTTESSDNISMNTPPTTSRTNTTPPATRTSSY